MTVKALTKADLRRMRREFDAMPIEKLEANLGRLAPKIEASKIELDNAYAVRTTMFESGLDPKRKDRSNNVRLGAAAGVGDSIVSRAVKPK